MRVSRRGEKGLESSRDINLQGRQEPPVVVGRGEEKACLLRDPGSEFFGYCGGAIVSRTKCC